MLTIQFYAFNNCTSLVTLSIPENTYFLAASFYGCTSLTNISVSENNLYYQSIEGIVFSKDASTLLCILLV